MSSFRYSVRNAEGRTVSGTIAAGSPDDAINQLRAQNMVVLSLQEERGSKGMGDIAIFKKDFWTKSHGGVRVKSMEMVVFTRQFSTMVSAGISVLESLETLADQQQNAGFKDVLLKIVDALRTGVDLSEAFAQHPKVFQKIYVNMLRAGEASGQLDEVLTRLAEQQQASAKLKSEIKAAMTYPIVSLVLILGITIFLLVAIIPKFKPIFGALGGEDALPTPTKILLDVSSFLQTNFLYFAIGCALLAFGLIAYKKTEQGRGVFDWMVLHMPVFGSLFQKVAISRFSRTFATLIESGVPILGALDIVAATSGNKIVEDAVNAAKESIRHGDNLAKPLSQSKVFPPMVTKMIAIGERSGALESLLKKVSEFYDEQVSTAVESLTAMIEPLMIGIMGFLVGGIVLAVFLPIFKLQEQLAGGG